MKIDLGLLPQPLPVINSEHMQSIIRQVFDATINVNKSKGGEYSGQVNALANFERLGIELEMTPEKVLWVYFKKHLDSIRSYIIGLDQRIDPKDQLTAPLAELSEPIEGRILDAIAYMCLLVGQCQRRHLQNDMMDISKGCEAPVVQTQESQLRQLFNEPASPATVEDYGKVAESSKQPAEEQGPIEVNLRDLKQQTIALTIDRAEFGMFIRLLYNDEGQIVQPGADIAESVRYKVVAKFGPDGLMLVDEQGVASSVNLGVTPVMFYTLYGELPVLPDMGGEYLGGVLTAIMPEPGKVTSYGPWDSCGQLSVKDEQGFRQHLVPLDQIAAVSNKLG